jgi:hypothetical protein
MISYSLLLRDDLSYVGSGGVNFLLDLFYFVRDESKLFDDLVDFKRALFFKKKCTKTENGISWLQVGMKKNLLIFLFREKSLL